MKLSRRVSLEEATELYVQDPDVLYAGPNQYVLWNLK
jgi:hypothetical protein